ncbi:MAG: FAD-dependent oxidoreductase [Caldilinea sp. CFX5]|nr:FAD-dependent oxidoreductase [Caldilinea sp. CFX5]
MQHTTTSNREHVIVIGASMAGLVAARVLADHYQQVTVLERDTFPVPGENRKGVPQGRHAHALLPSGRGVLETLFPGVSQELVAQGAIVADSGESAIRMVSGSYHLRFQTGVQSLFASRPRLEAQVRRRLLALPNVEVIENCHVLGVTATAEPSRVTGVRLVRRRNGPVEVTLAADLVVDASGRGSQSPVWLAALGYAKPEEEQVKVNVGYVSRVYRRKPGQAQGAYLVNIGPLPSNRRLGVMIAMEDDRWLVTLAGYLGDHPPTDPDGFLAYAQSLAAPDIYEVIRNAEPLTDPLPATFPASTRRRYEQMDRFPAGYLIFGDAISSFNPIYGQGMSVAALEALVLQRCLQEGEAGLAQRFFAEAAKLVDIPWAIAVGGDLRFPEVDGERSALKPVIDWYMTCLHRAARHDPAVVKAFGKVANLVAPPSSLLQPRVAWRVLLGNLRWRQAPVAPPLQEAHSRS